jgi:uncharacterized repeat protein (TIGR03803 family)
MIGKKRSGRAGLRGGLQVILLMAVAVVSTSASAQTLTTLHSFGSSSTDGIYPYAGLIDESGNLYGTTVYGGAYGYGTVFKLTPKGIETVLHSFGSSATDGQEPFAGLIADAYGNLYGTTEEGGANGYGTVFKVTPSGTETVLYSFGSSATDGKEPYADLIDWSGNLYGTTVGGGAHGYGTAFKLTPKGIETVLYSFGSSATDGRNPFAGLIADKSGNLYGTTFGGGANNAGTVFKLTLKGIETVLYSFGSSATDGQEPYAGLIDESGNLYGTTEVGGAYGDGTVFKLTPKGIETVLHSFGSSATDGRYPPAGLVDESGNLYGTTFNGGANAAGTVFKVTPKGIETVLYSFGSSATDGRVPYAGLTADKSGNLYGTTFDGGANYYGTAFKLAPK